MDTIGGILSKIKREFVGVRQIGYRIQEALSNQTLRAYEIEEIASRFQVRKPFSLLE